MAANERLARPIQGPPFAGELAGQLVVKLFQDVLIGPEHRGEIGVDLSHALERRAALGGGELGGAATNPHALVVRSPRPRALIPQRADLGSPVGGRSRDELTGGFAESCEQVREVVMAA